MLIKFRDASGKVHHRTLTRLNVRKVAYSIKNLYQAIPISWIIAILENSFHYHEETVYLKFEVLKRGYTIESGIEVIK